jgi:hypothetical protein
MLTTQQQALIKAIEELELAQVQKLLAEDSGVPAS